MMGFSLTRGHGFALAAALLAGCGGGGAPLTPAGAPPTAHETGLTALSAYRIAALTMPNFHLGPVRPYRGKSWMTSDAKKKSGPLLYVGDWEAEAVYVFSGFPKKPELVGTLKIDTPYGMCVDKKGDIFISTIGYNTYRFTHGGTTPVYVYTTTGNGIGCSVSARGDVAITDFSTGISGAGQVCVWKGGHGGPACYQNTTDCYELWTFGYDNAGNLIGEGEFNSIAPCAILAGSGSMIVLSHKGIHIYYGAATGWDGKYIGLGDQEANARARTGVQDVTLSGTTLTAVGKEHLFNDNCSGYQNDVVNPFFTAKTNVTPASTAQATGLLGADVDCPGRVNLWAYPAGHAPKYTLTSGLQKPYGAAISIAE